MAEDTVKVMKAIIASLQRDLHAHKERMEKILLKQNEQRKQLNEAKEQVLEMADLKREYEMVVAENELLKRELEQYRMRHNSSTGLSHLL
ncbi:unnamed protein product [Litomosoides sigmodontis]|uniref:Uncharacterized protein n=1 Tax=Litomosoides sigmodontis TaxID=42156 RepID=A0A3P6T0B3_LITSI|nr:unnamed protein product [Litomosoides sigmodontis]